MECKNGEPCFYRGGGIFVRTGMTDLFVPVLAVVNKPFQQAANYVQAVTGLADLQAENLRLRAENARLKDWYQTALLLQDKNAALQDLLNVAVEPQHSYVTARVVSDAGNAYAKSLLVLAGRTQSVTKGQAVLSGEGVIGRVVEAGNHSSRVLLLGDINSRIPVQIEGADHHAVLAGMHDDMPSLLHLPSGGKVEDGARVITSGRGGMFPYGLPVGQVVANGDGYAVRPYADTDHVTFVRVLNSDGVPHLAEKTQ